MSDWVVTTSACDCDCDKRPCEGCGKTLYQCWDGPSQRIVPYCCANCYHPSREELAEKAARKQARAAALAKLTPENRAALGV